MKEAVCRLQTHLRYLTVTFAGELVFIVKLMLSWVANLFQFDQQKSGQNPF